jgi:hypothetical protein
LPDWAASGTGSRGARGPRGVLARWWYRRRVRQIRAAQEKHDEQLRRAHKHRKRLPRPADTARKHAERVDDDQALRGRSH